MTPVPADYDGDGKADPAAYDPTTGNRHILLSGQGGVLRIQQLGGPGAVPVNAMPPAEN